MRTLHITIAAFSAFAGTSLGLLAQASPIQDPYEAPPVVIKIPPTNEELARQALSKICLRRAVHLGERLKKAFDTLRITSSVDEVTECLEVSYKIRQYPDALVPGSKSGNQYRLEKCTGPFEDGFRFRARIEERGLPHQPLYPQYLEEPYGYALYDVLPLGKTGLMVEISYAFEMAKVIGRPLVPVNPPEIHLKNIEMIRSIIASEE